MLFPFLKFLFLHNMSGTEFRLPNIFCNLFQTGVVIVIVQRFLKKFGNDCNLGLKAVVIEEQNTNKLLKK